MAKRRRRKSKKQQPKKTTAENAQASRQFILITIGITALLILLVYFVYRGF